jgi:uncharacterized protein involved in tolerance to divalent cations
VTYLKIMMKITCNVITAVLLKEEDTSCMKKGRNKPSIFIWKRGICGKIN